MRQYLVLIPIGAPNYSRLRFLDQGLAAILLGIQPKYLRR